MMAGGQGMDHGSMDHSGMAGMDHSAMGHGGMDAGSMNHEAANGEAAEVNPHPVGWDQAGTPPGAKRLTYADLKALKPSGDQREPTQEIEVDAQRHHGALHLDAERPEVRQRRSSSA